MEAVYAGSFDPITRGHISIIKTALDIFSSLNVVVADNPTKKYMFSNTERLELIAKSLIECNLYDNVLVTTGITQLVVEFAKSNGAKFLIRGVRTIFDANEELTMAQINESICPEIKTIFIPAESDLSIVSSSVLKELVRFRTPVGKYCTKIVEDALLKRIYLKE